MSEDNKSDEKVTETIVDNKANRALLDEKKKLESRVTELETAEAAREAEEAAKKGEWEKLEKKLREDHQKAIDKLNATIAERDTELKTLKIDNTIKSEAVRLGVKPELMPAVEALLKSQAAYKDGVATIGELGIPEAMEAWAKSEAGLHFIKAAENTGTGATGSTSKANQYTKDNFNHTEFAELLTSDPAQAKAWAIAAGKNSLADAIQ